MKNIITTGFDDKDFAFFGRIHKMLNSGLLYSVRTCFIAFVVSVVFIMKTCFLADYTIDRVRHSAMHLRTLVVVLVSVWSCRDATASICFPNTLQVTTQPGNGFGGDPLLTQPIVQQLNKSGLPCTEDSASTIFVEIKNNPAIYAGVNAYNVTGTTKGEPFEPPRPYAEITFEKGIAAFSGLYITMLGNGFTLNFVSMYNFAI